MPGIPGYVFPRQLGAPLPIASKARGVWIEDTEGHRYLDASGGAVVVNLGHGREEIASAVRHQILQCHYVHPTIFTTHIVEELAEALARHSPSGIERFYFLSGGGEANETAVKLARQIHLESGHSQKFNVISRWKSYHGLTLGALSATGRTFFREPFAPMLQGVTHIHPPYCLRCYYGTHFPECNLRCAQDLEEIIQNLGPKTVSAFIAETVSGTSLAICPPPQGYWKLIRKICDRYNVLLILDEVMCGFGRTGKWFASEHYDIVPDIVTLGKGLSGGTLALSAVGVQSKYFEIIRSGSETFVHGGTYTHHPVAAAAGLATIKIMEQENLVERADQVGQFLGKQLKDRLHGHPHVADIRGIGMMWGVELAKNIRTLEPFLRKEKIAETVWKSLFERGVITYRSTALAGINGDALVIAPPFVIEKDNIDYLVNVLGRVLEDKLG
jgi:adenosylmethionine-8-amino-7-oxononanoate aminotransferase